MRLLSRVYSSSEDFFRDTEIIFRVDPVRLCPVLTKRLDLGPNWNDGEKSTRQNNPDLVYHKQRMIVLQEGTFTENGSRLF